LPFPVNVVFAKLSGQLRIGMPVEDALRQSSKSIRIPDFQFFAAAVVLQRTAGGNLLPTLEALGQLMRSRRAVQLKARAVTAEVRLTAYILSALPFLMIAALLVLSPSYLSPLFTDSRGHVILGLAAGGILTSAFVMRQMMRRIEDA
jgi:tight adherence protein B